MQIILIRHAEAVDENLALRDPHRHLTPRGREQARLLGDRLRWHDCNPTHVWTSPLVRALQTAELVLGRYEHSTSERVSIESVPDLAPDAEYGERAIEAALKKLPSDAIVFLVGHEPKISAIGGLLVRDPSFGTLQKAQAARIIDGRLRWRFACDAEAPTL